MCQTTRQTQDTAVEPTVYAAQELSKSKWKLVFSDGVDEAVGRRFLETVPLPAAFQARLVQEYERLHLVDQPCLHSRIEPVGLMSR